MVPNVEVDASQSESYLLKVALSNSSPDFRSAVFVQGVNVFPQCAREQEGILRDYGKTRSGNNRCYSGKNK
jgi:hypothetical protein